MKESKPRLVLDMDALASAAQDKAFRGGELLCAELARSDRFDIEFWASPQCAQFADAWLRANAIDRQSTPRRDRAEGETAIVLQPAGSDAGIWPHDPQVVRAHLVYVPVSDAATVRARNVLAQLDARTLVFVPAQQVKESLLRLRPDLSPAQVAVIPFAEASVADPHRSASLATDALLDADRRFRARPVSMLWQYPGEAPADAAAPASFLAFRNGAAGPSFGIASSPRQDSWPAWTDTLPASAAVGRCEGGMRTQGRLKNGTTELPLVSYVTVVRNNAATLGRAIESVQQQTYANVEHIVLDGASTDGTLDLILRHADRLDYFVSEPDRGLYDAINKAVPLARGQLICILNSDDWLEPHAAEIAVRRMRERTQVAALLATGAVIYTLAGEVAVEWPPMFVHPGSYFACANICHNGVYATRAAYERSGPYDTSFRIAADFKWVMACVDAGVEFVYTREATVNYSLGGTSGDSAGHSRECQRVVAERFPFLSRREVNGLYDSFFLFAHQPHDPTEQGNEAPTSLLRRLFVTHTGRPDFESALTWAAMTKLEHPSDRPHAPAAPVPEGTTAIPSVRRSAKDLAKGLLARHPRLYRAALGAYARLRS